MYFQLVSHKDIYDDDDESDKASDGPDTLEQPPAGRDAAGDVEAGAAATEEKKADDDEDELVLSFKGAIACLAFVTVLIAVLSELLVDSIEGAAEAWKMPLPFISVILLPIVGASLPRLERCVGIADAVCLAQATRRSTRPRSFSRCTTRWTLPSASRWGRARRLRCW